MYVCIYIYIYIYIIYIYIYSWSLVDQIMVVGDFFRSD